MTRECQRKFNAFSVDIVKTAVFIRIRLEIIAKSTFVHHYKSFVTLIKLSKTEHYEFSVKGDHHCICQKVMSTIDVLKWPVDKCIDVSRLSREREKKILFDTVLHLSIGSRMYCVSNEESYLVSCSIHSWFELLKTWWKSIWSVENALNDILYVR